MPVSVSDLTKIYGSQRAIDNISFEVKQGEILGFLGPNGAGKTTTMKIITCFTSPDSGTVEVGTYNIADHPLEIRKQIGYLPEHNPLYPDMYVHEFLDFAGKVHRLPSKQRKQRIAEVIDMTGLGREQHKKIGMLSKGYRQRVGLSQALLHDPEVLILDEPTSGLDPNQIIDIRNLIKAVGRNKTVIFSSHILSEVEAIADRVIIINRGQIITDQSLAQLQQEANRESLIEVELEHPGFDFSSLQEMDAFQSLEALSDTHFQFQMSTEGEVRNRLFWECARQENPILSLSKRSVSLEDIFRNLTQQPGDSHGSK